MAPIPKLSHHLYIKARLQRLQHLKYIMCTLSGNLYPTFMLLL